MLCKTEAGANQVRRVLQILSGVALPNAGVTIANVESEWPFEG